MQAEVALTAERGRDSTQSALDREAASPQLKLSAQQEMRCSNAVWEELQAGVINQCPCCRTLMTCPLNTWIFRDSQHEHCIFLNAVSIKRSLNLSQHYDNIQYEKIIAFIVYISVSVNISVYKH